MIIKHDPGQFQSYLEDTSNLKGKADILYVPESREEVADILRECAEKRVPVTCSGAGTGTTGGCVPLEGALLSLERLNNVVDIDPEGKTATVGGGLPLCELEGSLHEAGCTFRAKPTESLAFVGAAASTCASGVRGFRYGSIRKHIRRIEVVLGDGTVLDVRRKGITARKRKFFFSLSGRDFNFSLPTYDMPQVKSQAGYFVKDNMDLIDLFIGSEGTLGVITELELTVQPEPADLFDAVVFFDTEQEGLSFVDTVKDMKRRGTLDPAGLEFLDSNSLSFLREAYGDIPSLGSAVYFEQEIETIDNSDMATRWAQVIESSGGDLDRVWFGDTDRVRKKIGEFRHELPQRINEFLREHNQTKTATDIAVPDRHFHEMYLFYKDVAHKYGVHFVNFGHIGENHLHFNLLPRNEREQNLAKKAILECVKKGVSLGGTVSAEHGIGKIKKPYLEMLYGRRHIREMAALKRYFDAAGMLGRDNIFDRQLLEGDVGL